MYGRDSPHPWDPPRQRPATGRMAAGGDIEPTRRYSTGFNYAGMDGSGTSSGSGGFTTVGTGGGHSRGASHGGYSSGTLGVGAGNGGNAEKTDRDRVNQIIQNFFMKAAMIIIQARISIKPIMSPKNHIKKVNKWFNIELDETDAFREELGLWRFGDSFDPRPPPLIIETYLDTKDLTANQSLVILDGEGKKWNVDEATDAAAVRAGLNAEPRRGGRGGTARHEVILERWTVELSAPFDVAHSPELPVVYKKGIVLFRALYSYAGLMPTWKFRRRLMKVKLNTSALKINCRVINGSNYPRPPQDFDLLYVPLCQGDRSIVQTIQVGKVDSPAGSIKISVAYRDNCDFRVDDSEALLSSQFINLDEHFFRPPGQRPSSQHSGGREMSSLPSAGIGQPLRPDFNQAYGSLSSFHHQGANPIGASPLTALRSAAEIVDRSSLAESPIDRPATGLRSIHGSKASLRSLENGGIQRRPSLSFMHPFKTHSLSASPANSDQIASSPRTSLNRVTTPAAPLHRQRPSLGINPSSSNKFPQLNTLEHHHVTLASNTGPSPLAAQPMTRIASSFGQRRPRITSGTSRTDDDNNSSGKASYSSTTPGSGLYHAETGANSNEDLQIRDFMNLLANGQNQSLKSFGRHPGDGSGKRTGHALSKYQKMKDSHMSMADSISSSLLLQPSQGSPSNSSRHLSNVPDMIPSTTFPSSSSPGKPMSLHTPAVPSKLNTRRTAQYDSQPHLRSPHDRGSNSGGRSERDRVHPQMVTAATSCPLDIPPSPRQFGPRRPSSMTQQHLDGDPVEFNLLQSASSGSIDSAPLSLSRLLDLRSASETALPGTEESEHGPREANDGDEPLPYGPAGSLPRESGEPRITQRYPTPRVATYSGPGSPGYSSRGRFGARGRGSTPPTGSTSSLTDPPRGSSVEGRPKLMGRRTPSYSKNTEDEEFIFTMSDMSVAQHSRRSLDQERGGREGSAGPSVGRRGSRGGGGSGGAGSAGSVSDNARGVWN